MCLRPLYWKFRIIDCMHFSRTNMEVVGIGGGVWNGLVWSLPKTRVEDRTLGHWIPSTLYIVSGLLQHLCSWCDVRDFRWGDVMWCWSDVWKFFYSSEYFTFASDKTRPPQVSSHTPPHTVVMDIPTCQTSYLKFSKTLCLLYTPLTADRTIASFYTD